MLGFRFEGEKDAKKHEFMAHMEINTIAVECVLVKTRLGWTIFQS